MSNSHATASPKALVAAFFARIRTGNDLAAVHDYLAPAVIAHQVCSEEPLSIERSPQSYADNVREMIASCTRFEITLDQLIAEDDHVYARWTQRAEYAVPDQDAPATIVEFASAVYRVEHGRIVEYWLQVDRLGTQRQVALLSDD